MFSRACVYVGVCKQRALREIFVWCKGHAKICCVAPPLRSGSLRTQLAFRAFWDQVMHSHTSQKKI